MADLSAAEHEAMERAFSAIEEQMPALCFTGGEAERTALFEGLWLAARDARDQEIERLTEQRERVATTRNELHQKLERADSAVMRWRRRAVAAEAQVRELREALERIAKNDEGWGVGLSRKPSEIARAALAASPRSDHDPQHIEMGAGLYGPPLGPQPVEPREGEQK